MSEKIILGVAFVGAGAVLFISLMAVTGDWGSSALATLAFLSIFIWAARGRGE